MKIPQEAYDDVEGRFLYRDLCEVLTQKYGAKPMDDPKTGAWNGGITVPVSETPRAVSVRVERKAAFDYNSMNRSYEEARIRIGKKRYLVLKWADNAWHFDEAMLFSKVNEEILQMKGEYLAQQAERKEMEESRLRIAAELQIDVEQVAMRTPHVARVAFSWGHILLGYDQLRDAPFRLNKIVLDERKPVRVRGLEVCQIVDILDKTVGGENPWMKITE